TSTGKRTRHSAAAARALTALSVMSTIAGLPEASTCVSFFLATLPSTADHIHFDAPVTTRLATLFAVTIATPLPDRTDPRRQRVLAGGDERPQRRTVGGEQAGDEAPIGRQPGAMAIAAERRADRTHETDLAGAVAPGMARGDFAAIGR